MATMSPEEFLEKHGPEPEFLKPYCNEYLCRQYNDDLDSWLAAGSPKPSALYNRVLADVSAMQQLGCRCIIQ